MTRIAIVGAGAIGSVLGAFLSRAGEHVTLVGRRAHMDAVRQNGLRVDGRLGAFSVNVPTAEALDFKPDYAFLTVKSQDVLTALQSNLKFLGESQLVTFQNGARSDDLASSLVPRSHIVSAVVNISATYLTPGAVTLVYPGTLVIGHPFQEGLTPLEPLAAVLQGAAPTTLSGNIRGVHWLKLLFNLNNAFPALLNMGLHDLYAHAYMRQLAARVMREGLQTVRATGLRLESLPEVSVGLFRLLGVLPPSLAGLLIAWRARRIQGQWPLLGSTLQSLRRGQPTEIDYLNGEVVRLGAETGRPTPLNATLVGLVHEVEHTRQFMTVDRLRARMEAGPAGKPGTQTPERGSMANEPLRLRAVAEADLPIFYKQQLDPRATEMAAFPARAHEPFMAHWKKIMSDESVTLRTILFDGQVAGHIVCFVQSGEREVGYWIGREYWGQGIATGALRLLLDQVRSRPLYAHVARGNTASRRVLEKCGFRLLREDNQLSLEPGVEIEEYVLVLEQ